MNSKQKNQYTEIKNLQQTLEQDHNERRHFVDAEVSSSESEDNNNIRIVASRRKKKGRLEEMLMAQLLRQQRSNMKAHKKIYELQTEIDTEEVKSRYLKLDLNNAQVTVEEEKEKRLEIQQKLFQSRVENWLARILIVLYILWSMYSATIG